MSKIGTINTAMQLKKENLLNYILGSLKSKMVVIESLKFSHIYNLFGGQ